VSLDRTTEQRLDALGRANHVRSARAVLKGELKVGDRRATDVLEHPPAYAQKMKVYDLLLATPRIGIVKARKMLAECEVSPSKTIGGLSDRQRHELVRCVQRARVGITRSEHAPGARIT
jgi:hypothetical protein